MPPTRFPGPCVACGATEKTGYYSKHMCTACYKRSRRVPKPKRSMKQYSGPCVVCGGLDIRFIKKMCRNCYRRITLRGGNTVPREKYPGPCIKCGATDKPRYFKKMCPACYKRADYAKRVKSLKKFCLDCEQEISRLSRTGRCRNCHHRFRYATDEQYRLNYYAQIRKYHKTEKGKAFISRMNRKRRIQKFGVDEHIAEREWQTILRFYDNRCAYCGCKVNGYNATQDHVVPLAKGGSDTIENIVPACRSCNAKKGNGLPLTPVQVLLIVDLP